MSEFLPDEKIINIDISKDGCSVYQISKDEIQTNQIFLGNVNFKQDEIQTNQIVLGECKFESDIFFKDLKYKSLCYLDKGFNQYLFNELYETLIKWIIRLFIDSLPDYKKVVGVFVCIPALLNYSERKLLSIRLEESLNMLVTKFFTKSEVLSFTEQDVLLLSIYIKDNYLEIVSAEAREGLIEILATKIVHLKNLDIESIENQFTLITTFYSIIEETQAVVNKRIDYVYINDDNNFIFKDIKNIFKSWFFTFIGISPEFIYSNTGQILKRFFNHPYHFPFYLKASNQDYFFQSFNSYGESVSEISLIEKNSCIPTYKKIEIELLEEDSEFKIFGYYSIIKGLDFSESNFELKSKSSEFISSIPINQFKKFLKVEKKPLLLESWKFNKDKIKSISKVLGDLDFNYKHDIQGRKIFLNWHIENNNFHKIVFEFKKNHVKSDILFEQLKAIATIKNIPIQGGLNT